METANVSFGRRQCRQLVFAGTPEDLARCAKSYTGKALSARL
jgi:excinuclease UvrABC ATPase subunit